MDCYGVIGNPVEHSRSPWIHARFAALTGQTLRYDRLYAPLDGFADTLAQWRAAGGRGCNVTVPFKAQAAQWATHPSPRVQLAGACNTLTFIDGRIEGDNTDGLGLVQDITVNAGVPIAGRSLLLLGAGGAAAGVLGPLLQQKPQRVVLANRTASRAQALADRHAALAAACGVALQACGLDDASVRASDGFAIVINATASSLAGANVPVPASALQPGALALDMMYGPAAQGFLDWARTHGARARDGLGMLVEQAAQSFALWRGVLPPAARVLRELRSLLDS